MIERLRFDDEPSRLPPQNVQAEQAVLGSALLDREVIARVSPILARRDFYRPSHGVIFQAMLDLYDRAEPVDYLTLTAELDRTGRTEEAGGDVYIAGLASVVPTPIHAESYARAVADAGVKRRVISAGGKIAQVGFDPAVDAGTTIEKAEALLLEVASTRPSRSTRQIGDLLREYLDRLEAYRAGEAASNKVPTGYTDLDRILEGGLGRTDLVVLAARPGVGKTSLATGIAHHAAVELGAGVAIFSLEMTCEQITHRMLSAEAGVEAGRVATGPHTSIEEGKLGHVVSRLSGAALAVDDAVGLTISDLRSKVRRIGSEQPLDLVIVDHLQLMRGSRDGMDPVREMTEISGQLKGLAKDQGVAVLALSQLSRAVEQRAAKKPMLSDLRQSGSIEQDADVVMFLHRDAEQEGVIEVHVEKHRNGPLGQIDLLFNSRTTRFLDLEARPEGRPWWSA